ncbi:MAG: chromate efflux transporter [Planctomycetia bacterium]|nr:chromate efflux transporter [Planctomycetia bacterium]
MTSDAKAPTVTYRQALRVWIKVALLSFGGPAGQIAVMHRILVDEKRWISEQRFLHALRYCTLLPGPEAQQLATYIGWLLHGTRGGITAGTLFILPGIVAILLLSMMYVYRTGMPSWAQLVVDGVLLGLKASVIAIVIEAVVRIGRRVLRNPVLIGMAAAAFVAIFFFEVAFPLIVLGAGLLGWMLGAFWPALFEPPPEKSGGEEGKPAPVVDAAALADTVRPTWFRTLRVLAVCLFLWWAPVWLAAWFLGTEHVLVREGLFFSQAAVVTFGGAYAVLAYVGQQAVGRYQWISQDEMLVGLGMAETTPGPLIMVLQFVGFLAAMKAPGSLPKLTAAILGALLTTWCTFVPSFLFIFVGAPYVERLRSSRVLKHALTAITAAIVGVILNLAVWFSIHALFAKVSSFHFFGALRVLEPQWATVRPVELVIAAGALVAMLVFQRGMLTTLGAAALVGLVCKWLAA